MLGNYKVFSEGLFLVMATALEWILNVNAVALWVSLNVTYEWLWLELKFPSQLDFYFLYFIKWLMWALDFSGVVFAVF